MGSGHVRKETAAALGKCLPELPGEGRRLAEKSQASAERVWRCSYGTTEHLLHPDYPSKQVAGDREELAGPWGLWPGCCWPGNDDWPGWHISSWYALWWCLEYQQMPEWETHVAVPQILGADGPTEDVWESREGPTGEVRWELYKAASCDYRSLRGAPRFPSSSCPAACVVALWA